MPFFRVIGPVAVLAAAACGPASAELLKYEFVGETIAATVFIDTLTVPSYIFDKPPLGNFQYFGVKGTYLDNGVMKPALFTAAFFDPYQDNGLDLYTAEWDPRSHTWEPDLRFFSSTDVVTGNPNPTLYNGSVTHPELQTGSFLMTDWFSSTGGPLQTYSLTVTAVPEPATWALLTLGIGAVAWLTHRRKAPASR